ncbi:hypothetical protein F4779DRAFT_626251 [Xylariaceae sp. FL0662B]|nr:hypothetical protein F4779DRAFT_626251 [Xylariaceae sp. FL0662B]
MNRQVVTLRKIEEVRDIQGSQLQCARFNGWSCAVRANQFQAGDVVLFFQPDAFLPLPNVDSRFRLEFNPLHNEVSEWQGRMGSLVKSIIIKDTKVVSQGVVIKLENFPNVEEYCEEIMRQLGLDSGRKYIFSTCFSGMLGVIKWELSQADASFCLAMAPAFLPSMEHMPAIQNYHAYTKSRRQVVYQESVKLDGIPMAAYYVKKGSQWYNSAPMGVPADRRPEIDTQTGRFGLCCHNRDLDPKGSKPLFWDLANRYRLKKRLEEANQNLAILGEVVGSEILGNPVGLPPGQHRFYVWAMWNIDTQAYLRPQDVEDLAQEWHLDHVPVLGYGTIRHFADTQIDLFIHARGLGPYGKVREGVVFKRTDNGIGFKVPSSEYADEHGR